MNKFHEIYLAGKQNRWYWLFYVFCRMVLAFAFVMAGMVKILGERFASGLSVLHPMGAYLEALHHTGYYYTFVGYAQVIAAVLLLIPRTVVLGALIYFPIILNIWVLSFAVRFDGSFVTSPLMVLANLFILVWHYDKIRFLLPFKQVPDLPALPSSIVYSNKFPLVFFGSVFLTVVATVLFFLFGLEVMPRNTLEDCQEQFVHTAKEKVGFDFCACIHEQGHSLEACLEEFGRHKAE